MALGDHKNRINISSAQFALSNFSNVESYESFKSLNEILLNFRKKPDAWLECECLFHTQDEIQVFYGIIILIDLIKTKWNTLSSEHQECLSTFIMGKVLKLATSSKLSPAEEIILRKFNQCLIELFIIKWSKNEWSNFLPDLIQTCNSNEYLCQNNLVLFKCIYELIYHNRHCVVLTTSQLDNLLSCLSNKISDSIIQLILTILDLSRNVILVKRSIDLLELFIQLKFDLSKHWDKLFQLLSSLLLVSIIRRDSMRALLVLLKHTKNSSKLIEYYKKLLEQLIKIIPSSMVLKDNFSNFKDEDQSFLVLIADLLAEYTPLLYHYSDESNSISHNKSISSLSATSSSTTASTSGSTPHKQHDAYLEDAWLFMLRLSAIDSSTIQHICFEYWSQLSSIVVAAAGNPSVVATVTNTAAGLQDSSASSTLDEFKSKAIVYLSEVADIIMINNSSESTNALLISDNGHLLTDINDSFYLSIQNTFRNCFFLNTKSNIDKIQSKFTQLLNLPQVSIRQLYSVVRCINFVMSSSDSQFSSLSSTGSLVEQLLDLQRFCYNSLLTLHSQMLRFTDQIPVSCAHIYLIGAFVSLGKFHRALAHVSIKRLNQYCLVDCHLIKQMALEALQKWTWYYPEIFLTTDKPLTKNPSSNAASTSLPSTVAQSSSFFNQMITGSHVVAMALDKHQLIDFFDYMTQIVIRSNPHNSVELYQMIVTIPNHAWQSIINQLTEDAALLINPQLIESLQQILEVNCHLCSTIKSNYLIQLELIIEDLMNLFNINSLSLYRIKSKSHKKLSEIISSSSGAVGAATNSSSSASSSSSNYWDLSQQLHQTCLMLFQRIITDIAWNHTTFTELSDQLIGLLLADYSRCSDRDQYYALVGVLNQYIDVCAGLSGQHSSNNNQQQQHNHQRYIINIITDILPVPCQSILDSVATVVKDAPTHPGDAHHHDVDMNDASLTHTNESGSSGGSMSSNNSISDCAVVAMMQLIKSLVRNYISMITNSNQLPFINLIYLIDFVLLGLNAVRIETRQLAYSIIEMVLQHYESDKVNSHQRKKFIRQFYVHIFKSVLSAGIVSPRISDEEGFCKVIRPLSRWLSSSMMSYRLISRSNQDDNKKSQIVGTINEQNRDALINHLVTNVLLGDNSNTNQQNCPIKIHTEFIGQLLKISANNNSTESINDLIGQYLIEVAMWSVPVSS